MDISYDVFTKQQMINSYEIHDYINRMSKNIYNHCLTPSKQALVDQRVSASLLRNFSVWGDLCL